MIRIDSIDAPGPTSATPPEVHARHRNDVWRAFYETHAASVRRILSARGVPSCDIGDLLQEVFVVALRHWEGGTSIESPGAFLRGIAVRRASRHHRWRRVRRGTLAFEAVDLDRIEGQAFAWEHSEISEALARLDEELRQVVRFADIEGYTSDEVARLLEVSRSTVRTRRRRAHATLRDLTSEPLDASHDRDVSLTRLEETAPPMC